MSLIAFPDAMLGVQSRFENQEETQGRFLEIANVLPPVALATSTIRPSMGTGMQQELRAFSRDLLELWDADKGNCVAPCLVELGPIGYSLI